MLSPTTLRAQIQPRPVTMKSKQNSCSIPNQPIPNTPLAPPEARLSPRSSGAGSRLTARWRGFLGGLLAALVAGVPAFSQVNLTGVPTGGGSAIKLRVSNPTVAQALTASGGELIGDYGAFQLFRANAALAAGLVGQPGVEDVTGQNVIQLNARPLDTTLPEVKAMRTAVSASPVKRLHLLQFAGPVKPEWQQELERNGGIVVTYIPHNAYLIYASGTVLSQIQTWAAGATYVQWDGPYLDEFKLHPRARLVDEKGQPQKPASEVFTIQMVADPTANAATLAVIDRYKSQAVRQQSEFLGYVNVTVALPAERLPELAAQPEVVSIQPHYEPHRRDERQNQIMAGNLIGSAPSGPGYLAWLLAKGFTQEQFTLSGFAVDVTDSGIDNGTTAPGHFGLYLEGDTSQTSRVVYNRLQGTPNSGSTILGCDGHGTINAHIIGGFNDSPLGFPHTDAEGYRYGLGICPFVKVGSSVIFDPNNYTFPNLPNLQSAAYEDGARITSNSWGADTGGGYNTDAQAFDALVRDAQPSGSTFPAPGNQEMVVVFAAGNAGPGSGSVGAPGSAKNVLTVGAAENVRSLNTANGGNNAAGDDGCDEPDTSANSADDIIGFSSRGPCDDQRKKPDLVAPGTHITGGVAQNSPPPSPTGTGSSLPCFDGTGVCALPGGGTTGNANNYFPLAQQFYTESSGTSHSTPAVAGGAALLRQYFINQSLTEPSPAMTKAFLMNSTRYLTGVGANDSLWSNNQGMGGADLGMTFDGVARALRDQLALDKFTASGQSRTWTGTIADTAKPFRVTLAWTDAPGSTTGNAYRNDLDLVVTVGGATYKGNVFSGPSSVAGGTADPRNNVESVFVPAGVSGNYAVTVTAANINSDGVPNELPSLDQDFAIVIYNAIEVPAPAISPESATLTAESCVAANGVTDPGETVTFDFSLANVGTTNTTALVATLLPINGVQSPSGPQAYGALTPGGGAVAQSFSFTASGLCGGIISPTFQLQDDTNDLGLVTFNLPLGAIATVSAEDFDSVSAPSLPSGWTTTATGGGVPWVTSTAQSQTPPNSVFAPDVASASVNELVSPPFPVPAAGSQLTFRHSYATESGFDGGVLEIKIGGGAYGDILTAGGSFAAGGYNSTLATGTANPLTGRPGWSGASGGFITTIVNLPAAAVGQFVQFRWRMGTDDSVSGTGWYVDTVSFATPVCCGDASAPFAGFSATPLSGAAPLTVTFTDTSFGDITNRFWNFGNGVTTNTTATNFTFTFTTAGTFTVSLIAQGTHGDGTLTRANYITVTNPAAVLAADGYAVTAEKCVNAGVDPGEQVTLSLGLKNLGTASTTNLVATLLPSGGVTAPDGPRTYGAIAAGGGTGSQPFTFTATGSCGGNLVVTLQLQDGATAYGTVTFPLTLGATATALAQNFDGVTAPALPSGWTTTASGGQANWSTSTATNSSAPNAAFSFDAGTAGVNELVSPIANIPAAGARLSFRNRYDLEASTGSSTYDAGVLEIKIGAGAFTDIVTAGGSFVSGGYNRTVTASSNPLNGRACWSGTSSGFINTVINLPPAAAGQNVQFRWRCGTDSSVSRPGWWIDDIAVTTLACCVATRPVLLSPQMSVDGVFSCVLSGDPGTYLIETGTTLGGWSPGGTVTNVTGQVAYSYTNSVDDLRVFRARLLP